MNRPKRLGTEWESACVAYIKPDFPDAERRAQAGSLDKGDIKFGPYIAECKNLKSIDLAAGCDELTKEIANAGVRFGFLLVKRRRKSTGDAYAVMPFRQLMELLQEVLGD